MSGNVIYTCNGAGVTERWLPVVGWENYYEVSDKGRVRSLDRKYHPGRTLRPYPDRTPVNYRMVTLVREGERTRIRVHVLVLEAFTGLRPDGLVACHGAAGPHVNTPENLRWDTPAGNVNDAVVQKTHRNSAKKYCAQGHPFTPENMRLRGDKEWRVCLKCEAQQRKERNQRRRGVVV